MFVRRFWLKAYLAALVGGLSAVGVLSAHQAEAASLVEYAVALLVVIALGAAVMTNLATDVGNVVSSACDTVNDPDSCATRITNDARTLSTVLVDGSAVDGSESGTTLPGQFWLETGTGTSLFDFVGGDVPTGTLTFWNGSEVLCEVDYLLDDGFGPTELEIVDTSQIQLSDTVTLTALKKLTFSGGELTTQASLWTPTGGWQPYATVKMTNVTGTMTQDLIFDGEGAFGGYQAAISWDADYEWSDFDAATSQAACPGMVPLVAGDTATGAVGGTGADYVTDGTYVAVDIKPHTSPNDINLGSRGTVPVGILSSATFDATQVDPATVVLEGAAVRLKGKGTPQAALEDIDGDGLMDLVVHVATESLLLEEGSSTATVSGATYAGEPFEGVDNVNIVP